MPEKPWLQLAKPDDHPDPLDPGGDSLADVNGEDADDEVEGDQYPFFVRSHEDADRWDTCEELAEKMTDGDVELTPLVARSLYFGDIPTDENDTARRAAPLTAPPSTDVPAGIEEL